MAAGALRGWRAGDCVRAVPYWRWDMDEAVGGGDRMELPARWGSFLGKVGSLISIATQVLRVETTNGIGCTFRRILGGKRCIG